LRPEANGICAADPWSVHLPAFPGKRAVRLVQRLAIQRGLLACPACGKDVSRRAVVCPSCGRMLKQRTRQWLSRAEWRTIGVATILFVGVPAAVIFFLVVLCAPRGH
jgi:hypothetical protein